MRAENSNEDGLVSPGEMAALAKRRRNEFRPLDMTDREVEVLHHMLTLAETAIYAAKVRFDAWQIG